MTPHETGSTATPDALRAAPPPRTFGPQGPTLGSIEGGGGVSVAAWSEAVPAGWSSRTRPGSDTRRRASRRWPPNESGRDDRRR